MGKITKEQLLKILEKHYKSQELLNKKEMTPFEYYEGKDASDILRRVKNKVLNKISSSFNSYFDLIDYMKLDEFAEKDIAYAFLDTLKSNKINGTDKVFGAFKKDILDNKEMTDIEKYHKIEDYLRENQEGNIALLNVALLSRMKRIYGPSTSVDSVDEMSIYLDILERTEKVEDMDFTVELMTNKELSRYRDKHTKEQQINEIISSNNLSQDQLDVLQRANEICLYGTNESTSAMTSIAEGFGEVANYIQLQDDLKYLKDNNVDFKDLYIGKQTYTFENASLDKQSQYAKNVFKDKATIPEDLQKQIIDIVNEIKQVDPNGGLTALTDARDNLSKAIDNKNMEEIAQRVKEYNETDNKINKIFNKLNNLGDMDRFPLNMSMARQSNIPERYRNDIRGATIYRMLCNTIKCLDDNNVRMDDFLKDPIECYRQMSSNLMKNGTFSKFVRERPLNDILSLIDGDRNFVNVRMESANEGGKSVDVGQLTAVISTLMNKNDAAKLSAQGVTLFNTVTSYAYYTVDDFVNNDCNQNIANLIAVEPNERDLFSLNSKEVLNPDTLEKYEKFNLDKYLQNKKTTPENIIDRMFSSANGFSKSNWFEPACKLNAEALKRNAVLMTDSQTKFIVDKIIKEGINSVSKTDVDIFYTKRKLDEGLQNGNLNKDELCNELYDLKQEYSSRSFFWKIFGRDTGRLSNNIDQIKNKLLGVMTKNELDAKLSTIGTQRQQLALNGGAGIVKNDNIQAKEDVVEQIEVKDKGFDDEIVPVESVNNEEVVVTEINKDEEINVRE